ncbi:MAG: D-alanyl-D-alanine carboxypeptidase/D-alanyl-D-alanine-endopeptidase [Acidimicrobiia bacterium]|nr:D-alanyl-D-alanine carboxypeptidase/D-alanyl-D-alanine-endopeptidase [Acidimicrobiia bacterium]
MSDPLEPGATDPAAHGRTRVNPRGRPSGGRRRRGRGPGPYMVLVAIAVVPAIALFTGFRWADGQVVDDTAAPVPSSTVVAPPAADPPLTTGMLSTRRFPTIASRSVNVEVFEADVVPFYPSVNDRSCVAMSVDGIDVGSKNEAIPVIPASNQKIVVAAVAMDELGEGYRYETKVNAAAQPVGGVVDGDLYLVGGGDPLLSSDWYATSNLERHPVTSPTSLDSLADSVVAAGVVTVNGAVVGDGSRYDDEFFAPGWGTGVAGLEAGPYDALMVNDSRVLNDPLKANDPNEGASREFLRLLQERGVTITGGSNVGVTPESSVTIASIDSAPMSDVVGEMLANSDNNTAELVVKEIGLATSNEGSRTAGLVALEGKLVEWGIDTTNTVFADGSGLSPDNRLTCAAILTILQRNPADGPIGAGLAVAGESGTLSDTFADHEIAGRLLGKTGTLNNPPFNQDPPAVKALAGYVLVDGGSAVEYVLLLNGPTISDQSEYRATWYELADLLAAYPAGPTPADLGPR